MSICVVDSLEVVKIDHCEGELFAVAIGAGHFCCNSLQNRSSIKDARQGIVSGLTSKFLLKIYDSLAGAQPGSKLSRIVRLPNVVVSSSIHACDYGIRIGI